MPEFVTSRLREGFRYFGKVSRGFLTNEATMIGVETRTSAPVRIVRDRDTYQHVTVKVFSLAVRERGMREESYPLPSTGNVVRKECII